MQYTNFPGSTRRVSRLGFGAMGFAEWHGETRLGEAEALRAVLKALDLGVTFIDTARGYGRSEALVGKALQEWRGERPFLATKVPALGDGAIWAIPPKVEDAFPRGHIIRSAELSLRELRVDQLDLLQLHLYWPTWGSTGYWLDELLILKEQGKVAHIGVSNPDHRADTVLPLVLSGQIDCVQTILNIFDPLAVDCLLPICQDKGVAVIARGILDEGGLTGFLQQDTQFEETDFRKSFFECVPRELYLERVQRLRAYVPRYARSLAALAIKFAVHHPGVTTAITSMHIEQYTQENIDALAEPPLPQEVFEELRRKQRWIRNFFDSKYWS